MLEQRICRTVGTKTLLAPPPPFPNHHHHHQVEAKLIHQREDKEIVSTPMLYQKETRTMQSTFKQTTCIESCSILKPTHFDAACMHRRTKTCLSELSRQTQETVEKLLPFHLCALGTRSAEPQTGLRVLDLDNYTQIQTQNMVCRLARQNPPPPPPMCASWYCKSKCYCQYMPILIHLV